MCVGVESRRRPWSQDETNGLDDGRRDDSMPWGGMMTREDMVGHYDFMACGEVMTRKDIMR